MFKYLQLYLNIRIAYSEKNSTHYSAHEYRTIVISTIVTQWDQRLFICLFLPSIYLLQEPVCRGYRGVFKNQNPCMPSCYILICWFLQKYTYICWIHTDAIIIKTSDDKVARINDAHRKTQEDFFIKCFTSHLYL